ncbi:MAG: hypothetical protein A2270_00410 [Elusimicrobia bacterium RIFOXYA12_FULL_51_18]|nr:MAG: hypothetical protein A2270_00410 [Elusimicrobia bacterium RIFOXYA12_FULL_51_18]OGS32170.1 MAG: hypothetical protein A2218_07070 [Elusimicrobia bacterium RIFOXYA2_FULL_53_38]
MKKIFQILAVAALAVLQIHVLNAVDFDRILDLGAFKQAAVINAPADTKLRIFTIPAKAAAPVLTRGPYVQMGHSGVSTTIVWRTAEVSDGRVDYGLTAAYGANVVSPSNWQHEATLTGLRPGAKYYYRVSGGGLELAKGEFVSGKAPGQPFRIAMFSDAHQSGTRGIGYRMSLSKPDLILAAGDITDSGLFQELDGNLFSNFWEVLRSAPLYWTPGNHDVDRNFAECRNALVLPQDELNYWFEYSDAQIVSLNAEGLPGPNWLANALASSKKPWKIVFFHEPAFSPSGGHGENSAIRDTYVPIMEKYGVQLTVSGHNHFYWRSVPINGITHIVDGVSGNRARDIGAMPCSSAFGFSGTSAKSFVVVDISGNTMVVRAIGENGAILDETIIDRDSPFQLDGLLDGSARQVASRPDGLGIWAAISGRYLYVATQDAGEGYDNFLFLARKPAPVKTAVWAKAGGIMAHDAFLADENDSSFTGWFRGDGGQVSDLRAARSASRWCNGNYVEGVIDLQQLYGGIPPVIYLAAAPYATADGGALAASRQCPAGNGDNNIDPAEFIAVNTAEISTGISRLKAGSGAK